MTSTLPVSQLNQQDITRQFFQNVFVFVVVISALALLQPTRAAGQGALINGGNHFGIISVAFAQDLWTFEATSGDTIALSMSVVTNSQSIRPWIRLRGPDGVELVNVYGRDLVSLVSLVATQSGTYTVVAASNNGSGSATGTGDYVLRLARTPASFVVPNGDEGGPLVNGANHIGTIPLGDMDLWTFEATSGDTIALSMSVVTNSQSIRPWIRLRGPDGVELVNVYGRDLVSLVSLVATQSGTYTVVAASNNGSGSATGTGDYVLRLARTPASFVVPNGDEGGPLVNGANHIGTIPLGDMDLWTFEATSGDTIALSMSVVTNSQSIRPWIRLRGPDGVELVNVYGRDLVSLVSLVATQSGTYTVVAASNNGSGSATGTGDYVLRLARTPASFVVPNGDEGGPLVNGANHIGTIPLGDMDLWTFEATSGDTIALSMSVVTNSQSIRPWIRLRGPDGVELVNVYGRDLVSLVSLVATQSGTYTVVAASNNGSGSATGTGDYVLRLARTPASFVVPNGDEGGPLVNGANHIGTIPLGDMDLWTFEATSGDTIALSMSVVTNSQSIRPWIRLRGPDGVELVNVYGRDLVSLVSLVATQSGTYTVVAASNNGSGSATGTGDYVLRLARTPASFVVPNGDEGGPLVNGANHIGTIPLGDMDLWTFEATSGDTIALSMSVVTNSQSIRPWIRLRGPDGVELVNVYGRDLVSLVSLVATQSGTYTVVAASNNGSGSATGTGDYVLRLARTPASFVVPNGDEGGPLVNGANHIGTIPLGDMDLWTFEATSGDTIALSMSVVTNSQSIRPWIRLRGPDGVELVNVYGRDLVSLVSLVATQSGTYTVVAASNNGSGSATGTGDYVLRLARTPASFVVPNGDEGGPLVNGANHIGTIPLGDMDLWTFEATSGDTIALSMSVVTNSQSIRPWIRLRGPDGVELVNVYGRDLVSLVSLVATQSGTYTVVAASNNGSGSATGTGDYVLRLARTPASFVVPNGDEGGPLVNGANHIGTIPLGDMDLWTFEADRGNSITIQMHEITGDASFTPLLRVYGPVGQLISTQTHASLAQLSFTAPDSGIYVVVVASATVTGTGNYRISAIGLPEQGKQLRVALQLDAQRNKTFTVNWPSAVAGHVLQWTKTVGDPTSWEDILGAVNDNGLNARITIPVEPGNRFFRLKPLD